MTPNLFNSDRVNGHALSIYFVLIDMNLLPAQPVSFALPPLQRTLANVPQSVHLLQSELVICTRLSEKGE